MLVLLHLFCLSPFLGSFPGLLGLDIDVRNVHTKNCSTFFSSSSNQENNIGPQDQTKNGQAGQAAAPHITGQAIKSGIVRIWQSWRSTDRTECPSFTHKRGVTIQPIEVRGSNSGPYKEGGAACRRNMFQRRRGGSSPLSPQQLEALAREDSMSPTSFR